MRVRAGGTRHSAEVVANSGGSFEDSRHRVSRLALKRAAAGQHLVKNRAHSKDVAAMVDRLPRTCSGDMYPAVPSTVPGVVSTRPVGTADPAADNGAGSVSFANPKSRIFARPSVVMKMFSGFRSR